MHANWISQLKSHTWKKDDLSFISQQFWISSEYHCGPSPRSQVIRLLIWHRLGPWEFATDSGSWRAEVASCWSLKHAAQLEHNHIPAEERMRDFLLSSVPFQLHSLTHRGHPHFSNHQALSCQSSLHGMTFWKCRHLWMSTHSFSMAWLNSSFKSILLSFFFHIKSASTILQNVAP